jgi:hypothetical protein
MQRWQAAVLLGMILTAAEPAVGDAGLAALAQTRAGVQAVQVEARRTVTRIEGETGDPPEERRVALTATADGCYLIVIRPADPEDVQRTIFQSDGVQTWTIEVIDPELAPDVRVARAGADDAVFRQLLAAIRLDLEVLRASYAIELVGDAGGQRRLRLTPTDPAIARDLVQITVLIDAAGVPQRATLDLTSGNRETYVVGRFIDNPPVDPKIFRPGGP